MLNTSLSVRAHQANSHSGKGWEQFTDSILKVICARAGPGVVFFAWGNPAQKRTANIITSTNTRGTSLFSKNKKQEDGSNSKHLILKSVHPSPLSANRGFFGNGHFKKANEWLKEKYGEDGMIDWCTIDPEEPEA
jgi:uracil-DNA glycosylase